MATIIFTAIGTALGGPLGGVLGAIAGQQVDSAIFGGRTVQGPRLKDLSITTSSYGSAVPRHFGTMRVGGSIIWATDLQEHSQNSGGGKGQPSVTTYSYSTSFAVAVSSRPIAGIGRIWADGNLLRGAGGDLKVGGTLRIYNGHQDQQPDPLIASAEGAGQCPAFRGMAYVVFESLQLADFGNRIPTLTFEILADGALPALNALMDDVVEDISILGDLSGIEGFSCEGTIADTLAQFQPLFPMMCDANGNGLTLRLGSVNDAPLALPEAAITTKDSEFQAAKGFQRSRIPPSENPITALRYYDKALDYQPGTQHVIGQSRFGRAKTIEVPAVMSADVAAKLVNQAARATGWSRDTMVWRCAQLDPRLAPGVLVTAYGQPGVWRINDWEWRDSGIELNLERVAGALSGTASAQSGRANLAADLTVTPSALFAFEVPWDGQGNGDTSIVMAAVSSSSAGWTGASLFADQSDGTMTWLSASGRVRSIIGTAESALAPASPLVIDRSSSVIVQLVPGDLVLSDATVDQMANGANRALLGTEVIQFGRAEALGSGRWRISTLMRGRGGTESAVADHMAGEHFALLDGTPIQLDGTTLRNATGISAMGLNDSNAVQSAIACRGTSLRPWAPVHPRAQAASDGTMTLTWTRRARGGWAWTSGVDVPLQEQSEAYLISCGPVDAPLRQWTSSAPTLTLSPSEMTALRTDCSGQPISVQQQGTHALSEPTLLMMIS